MGGSASIAQRYKTKESNNSWSAILSANNNFFVSADGHNEKVTIISHLNFNNLTLCKYFRYGN
jgi:hypothetical protein